MMLYPPINKLLDKISSRYLLVNVIARRARQVAAYAEENDEPLDEKPVSIAIEEISAGRLTAHLTDAKQEDEGGA